MSERGQEGVVCMSAVIVSFLYSLCNRYLTMEDTASSLLQNLT